MQYWLCITSLANWDIIEKESLWAVKTQAQKRIKKVEPGDKLVFYVKSPVQAIAGIYEAVSKVYIDAEQLPWDDGPYPCRIRIRLVGKVRNLKGTFKERNLLRLPTLIRKLKSVRSLPALQGKSMIAIAERDFRFIQLLLEKCPLYIMVGS